MHLLHIDLRPHSVHVQGFFVGAALSHFSDCDLLNFIGYVCNGIDNDFVLGLALASFIFFVGLAVLFPVSLHFLFLVVFDTKGDHF